MKIGFLRLGGFSYYDDKGKRQFGSVWWPLQLAVMVHSFFRILFGKNPVTFASTGTMVVRSANTHAPKDQQLSLIFGDIDSGVVIWGTELTANSARGLAAALVDHAEKIDPYYSTEAVQKEIRDRIQNQETTH